MPAFEVPSPRARRTSRFIRRLQTSLSLRLDHRLHRLRYWSPSYISPAILVHLVSFFATSFIEEEHEFWFFTTATAFLLLAVRYVKLAVLSGNIVLTPPDSSKRSISDRVWLLSASAAIRIMRNWSHNGTLAAILLFDVSAQRFSP